MAKLFFTLATLALFSPALAQADVRISAVGDIMMGTNFPKDRLPPNGGKDLFTQAAPFFAQSDLVFGNLEGPITTATKTTKNWQGGKAYAFRTPPEMAGLLKDAGFDLFSLANNHSMDFGASGMQETKKLLYGLGLQYSSKEGEVAAFSVNGATVAMIATATGPGPRTILEPEAIYDEIRALSQQYDIVIVSFHGGSEGADVTHTRDKQESLYGEPRGNVVRFARGAIDAGADLILGHGPHVPRALEVYRDRLIAYSLGNFCTYGPFKMGGPQGLAPLLQVTLADDGRFQGGNIVSFTQSPPGGPVFDPYNKAYELMKKLSQEDFPDSNPFADIQSGM